MPLLARSNYLVHRGWQGRGTDWASKTSEEQFEQLRSYHNRAIIDVEKALKLAPNLSLLYALKMEIGRGLGDRKMRRQALQTGLSVVLASYSIRYSHLFGLTPNWGGSYAEVNEFLADTKLYEKDNENLKPLGGFPDYTKGRDARKAEKFALGVTFLTRAIEYGDKSWFHMERGKDYYFLDEFDQAMADFDRALELYPESDKALLWRAWVFKEQEKFHESLDVLNLAVKRFERDPLFVRERGEIFASLEMTEQALADFKQAVVIAGSDSYSWWKLGDNAQHLLKDNLTAYDAYHHALELEPENTRYLYSLGVLLDKMRDCELMPIFRTYLQLCKGEETNNCSTAQQKWVSNVVEILATKGHCTN